MSFETFMHWFWVAIFAGLGLFLLVKPSRYRNIEAYFCHLRLPCSDKGRLLAAAQRRKVMENLSMAPTRVAGVFSLLLAAVAAMSRISPSVLYPIMCVAMCGFLGIAYMQLRNRKTRRVAEIVVRTPFTVLPAYWYGLAAMVALLPLADLRNPALETAAIIAAVCALTILLMAWRLATVPALLSGEDIPVERFVDERLRFIRTASALTFAPGVVFVYFTQTNAQGSRIHDLLGVVASFIWIGLFIALYQRQKRSPDASELETWQTPA